MIMDERDEAPKDVNGQGDPYDLGKKRTRTFPNRKLISFSTPTGTKGNSPIEAAYQNGSMGRWNYACQNCGALSHFEWSRLSFATIKMQCPHCEAWHSRREWEKSGGIWIHEFPDHKRRTFHASAMISKFTHWEELIDEFLEADAKAKQGDYSKYIPFRNAQLGESWEVRGEKADEHVLMRRREVYKAELPDGVCAITAGVDVQHNRLAVGIWGWGLGLENWCLFYDERSGKPQDPEVWNWLQHLMQQTWSFSNGRKRRIDCAAVDTSDGNTTLAVYSYIQPMQGRGVRAIKGQTGDKIPLTRPSKAGKDGIHLFMVGVDSIKTDLVSLLQVKNTGAGYCHFPVGDNEEPINGIDEYFFQMLTSETRVAKRSKKGAFLGYEWLCPSGKRNESWDCFVYARAALRIMSKNDLKMLQMEYKKGLWLHPGALHEESSPVIELPQLVIPPPARRPAMIRNQRAEMAGVAL
jgi:phage terminase large subunit GpA-like protein